MAKAKEVTREQVTSAVYGMLVDHTEIPHAQREKLAWHVAVVLGLAQPKPFVGVLWFVKWDDDSGSVYTSETEARDCPSSCDGRIFPILVTELSPDDPRLGSLPKPDQGEGEGQT